jgi:hypothetical protein
MNMKVINGIRSDAAKDKAIGANRLAATTWESSCIVSLNNLVLGKHAFGIPETVIADHGRAEAATLSDNSAPGIRASLFSRC